ncbi:MAG: AAA family ATPase [Chloroflexota bacterium]
MALVKIKASEIKRENETWLLYGPHGGGKTYVAGTFPRPIAALSSTREKGHTTLAGLDSCDVFVCDSRKDLDEGLALLYRDHAKYATLVLDGMTSFFEMMLSEVRESNIDSKHPDGYIARDDWTDLGIYFVDLLTTMRRYPWEVVWTANIGSFEDKMMDAQPVARTAGNKENPTVFLRAGPASYRWLAERLPPKFDNLIYMEGRADSRGVPTFYAYPSGLGRIGGRMRGVQPGAEMPFPTWKKLRALADNPLFGGKPQAAPAAPPPDADPGKPQ